MLTLFTIDLTSGRVIQCLQNCYRLIRMIKPIIHLNIKIKNLLNGLILLSIVALVSCEGIVVEKKAKGFDSHKLVAQTDIVKEEKVMSITEVLANDIAFAQLNKVVTSSDYEMKLNGNKEYTLLAPLNGAFNK